MTEDQLVIGDTQPSPEPPPMGVRRASLGDQLAQRRAKKAEEKNKELQKTLGLSDEQMAARLAREQYLKLPIDQKIRKLEQFISASVAKLGEEMVNLRHNDQVIADAMDVNFRAMSKLMTKLGVSPEEQGKVLEEAQQEVADNLAARANLRREAMLKAVPPVAQEEITAEEAKALLDKPRDPGEEPILPEGAAVFGG